LRGFVVGDEIALEKEGMPTGPNVYIDPPYGIQVRLELPAFVNKAT